MSLRPASKSWRRPKWEKPLVFSEVSVPEVADGDVSDGAISEEDDPVFVTPKGSAVMAAVGWGLGFDKVLNSLETDVSRAVKDGSASREEPPFAVLVKSK